MSVHPFPPRAAAQTTPAADAAADTTADVLRIGYAHYRRVEGDVVEAGAILRCAILLLADMAEREPDPIVAIGHVLGEMATDILALLYDPKPAA